MMAKKKQKRIKPRDPGARALAEMGVKPKVIPNRKPVVAPKVEDWND
jgi:hypothetical protein